ncbi:MAG TPA: NAD(P)-dependent oxidoreductase [Nocardioides sp.]|uniref:NAD(P)-dependent oxidoreductase n=1 Tax=Nocardioides sp. TaxID=35761 RepID=UPI002ED8B9DA
MESTTIGLIGVGGMGLPMVGHLLQAGFAVVAHDVEEGRLGLARERGAEPALGLPDLAARADTVIACLPGDRQLAAVVGELACCTRAGQVLVIAGTHSVAATRAAAAALAPRGGTVVDAPVVFGAAGAREGTLLSLCGGTAEDVARVRDVLAAYSGRGVEHVGPLGAGQIAKTCNNLLHWIHSIANYEAIALAKRYGIDAERMRQVLTSCPGDNGTLRRWEDSRFTWQEKDMDLVMDLAQDGGLVLPLTGQVDQLVKLMTAGDVTDLLHSDVAHYLGREIRALSPDEGGLSEG